MIEEEQLEVVRQARVVLKGQLARFGWSAVPRKSDPDGQALWGDSNAVTATRAWWREDNKLYYLRHLETVKERLRRYYAGHQEEAKEYVRLWQRANPEKAVEQSRLYFERHPGKAAEIRHRYHANLANAEGSFTSLEFEQLCKDFGDRCAYCGKRVKLVSDHMTPLSRGGTDFIWNIIPSCSSCNSSKGDKTLEEYLEYLTARLNIDCKEEEESD